MSFTGVNAPWALVLGIWEGEDAERTSRTARKRSPEEVRRMKLELEVGQQASRAIAVTEAHVRSFAQISDDYNRLHFDVDFVARTSFGRLVAQGGLTADILHALVAEDMPGPGTVFLSQDWKFTAPVFIGDTITSSAEVMSVHESKPACQLRVKVERDGRETVLEGEAWCYRFVVSDGEAE
jgi:acyl dehydratase